MIVRKANIIYPAENFYCAGIVMYNVRAGRRESQPATETLGHNIAKRWRMGETRCSYEK